VKKISPNFVHKKYVFAFIDVLITCWDQKVKVKGSLSSSI